MQTFAGTPGTAPDENGLRLMVEAVKDYAIFMLDSSGHVRSWNTGAAQIKGYSADEIIGQHFSVFYPPEDRAARKPERELEEAIRNGRVEDEGWRVRKDGSYFWANVVITAIYDHQGKLTGFGKVTRDLTDRRNAEEALRQSEERLRLMIESVSDYAVFMLDPTGKIISWNPGAQRIKGYEPQEIIGRHFSVFYTPESRAVGKPEQMLQRAASSGRAEDEGWRVRKDGTYFWGSIIINAVRAADGELLGFVKVTRDMSERKLAEEQRVALLREQAAREAAEVSQRQLAFLAEAGTVLSASLDAQTILSGVARLAAGRIADWCSVYLTDSAGGYRHVATAHADPATEEFLGELAQRYTATTADHNGLARALASGKTQLLAAISPATLAKLSDDAEQLNRLREMGVHSALLVPMVLGHEVLGAITLVRAETPRNFDQADAILAEDLSSRVALAVENARLYLQAREAVRAREDFLNVASHELRTPVTALQLQVQRLLRQGQRGAFGTPMPEALAPALRMVEQQLRRLTQLTDLLLDVTRLNAGKLYTDPTEFDLAQLGRELAETLKPLPGIANAQLEVSAAEPVVGYWDRTRMEQVIANLLSNAIKYGAGKPVAFTVAQEDQHAVITVRDQGIGIDPGLLPHLFEPFSRGVNSEHYSGLGLGLYVVKQLIDAHGGTIEVESEVGVGSTFTVRLPLQMESSAR